MKILFSTIIITLISISSLYSQVTIGDDVEPADGALLQLKDNGTYSGNVNASKGLILPRVDLTDEFNLFPMFEDDGSNGYKIGTTAYTKADEDKKHIGLMVYNTNLCLTHNGDGHGMFVWDGSRWTKLFDWNGSTVRGISGKIYKTATFGDMEWMIENLEETQYDTESEGTGVIPTGRVGATGTTDESTTVLQKVYYFPTNGTHTGNVTQDRVFYDNNKGYGIGLFYSWAAASAEQHTDAVIPGVAPGQNSYSTVQGICPNGWRLPSERDWLDLEKELLDHPSMYTTQTVSPGAWDSSYETNTGEGNYYYRGVAGNLFKSQCLPVGYELPADVTYLGYSKPTGFNVIMVGFMGSSDGTIPQPQSYYGSDGSFWTSSAVQVSGVLIKRSAWGRNFVGGNTPRGQQVARGAQASWQLQAVRCVKARN